MKTNSMHAGCYLKCCFFLGLALLISCTNEQISDIDPSNKACTLKDSVISFNRHIVPLFTTFCALSGCHSGSTAQSNLNLDASVAYSQLIRKGRGYIDTINPSNSVLVSSILSVDQPMPPTGKLDNCTIALIENWMKQGAKNN